MQDFHRKRYGKRCCRRLCPDANSLGYHALMKAMNTRLRLSPERVTSVVAGIWFLAMGTSILEFYQKRFSKRYDRSVCPFSLEILSSLAAHVICRVLLQGFLPFVLLACCYFQINRGLFLSLLNKVCSQGHYTTTDQPTQKRLAKLLMSVTAAFYICYLPFETFIFLIQ